jgi:hypothetical protein
MADMTDVACDRFGAKPKPTVKVRMGEGLTEVRIALFRRKLEDERDFCYGWLWQDCVYLFVSPSQASPSQ